MIQFFHPWFVYHSLLSPFRLCSPKIHLLWVSSLVLPPLPLYVVQHCLAKIFVKLWIGLDLAVDVVHVTYPVVNFHRSVLIEVNKLNQRVTSCTPPILYCSNNHLPYELPFSGQTESLLLQYRKHPNRTLQLCSLFSFTCGSCVGSLVNMTVISVVFLILLMASLAACNVDEFFSRKIWSWCMMRVGGSQMNHAAHLTI